jgi:sulfur carrier protein
MTIVVNGGAREVAEGTTVQALLVDMDLGSAPRGVAVARNGDVVTRSLWPETALESGDRVEILHAVQGG